MQIFIPVNRKRVPTELLLYLALLLVWSYFTFHGSIGGALYQFLFITSLAALGLRVIALLIDYMKTLFDKKAGVAFTDAGMNDQRSIFSCGLISWKQIANLELVKVRKTTILLILVEDPAALIAAQPWWRKLFLKEKFRQFGTPVAIPEQWLDHDLMSLWRTLQPFFAARRQESVVS
jgi:hypothetical protein